MSRSLLSKSVATTLLGVALGSAAASARIEPVLNVATASESVASVAVPEAVATPERESCPAGELSRAGQLALVNHNLAVTAALGQTGKKPNILIIWGDDIGWNNPSACHALQWRMPDGQTPVPSSRTGARAPGVRTTAAAISYC